MSREQNVNAILEGLNLINEGKMPNKYRKELDNYYEDIILGILGAGDTSNLDFYMDYKGYEFVKATSLSGVDDSECLVLFYNKNNLVDGNSVIIIKDFGVLRELNDGWRVIDGSVLKDRFNAAEGKFYIVKK